MRMYSKPNETRTKEMQIAGDTLPPRESESSQRDRQKQTDRQTFPQLPLRPWRGKETD